MPFPVRRPFFTRALSAATLGVVMASLLVGVAWASTPTISLVAGTGTSGYNGDGIPAASAELNLLRALAVDTVGDVFVADTFNHRIRKIDTTGMITTVAGTGVAGSSGDGGPATRANMKWPHSVAVDKAGNLYITDSPNH